MAEGRRLEGEGNLLAALERYERAATTAPRDARPHLNAGIVLEALGEVDRAIAAHKAALAVDPAEPYANYNLGRLLFLRGEHSKAQPLLERALREKPDFAEAHVVMAEVCEAYGDLLGAVAALEAALKCRRDYPGAWLNYAALLRKMGRQDEAETALREAVRCDPQNPDAHQSLAASLEARGAIREAEQHYRETVANAPEREEPRVALIEIYRRQRKFAAATEQFEAVLRLRPDWFDAWLAHAMVLRSQRRLPEAEAALRRLLELDPGYVRAYRHLASALMSQLRPDEALQTYASARSRFPSDLDLESGELFLLNFSEQIATEELFERHRAFGRRLEALHPPRAKDFTNVPEPERRLRIGYLSGDFAYHVVTLFVLPLLQHHDRARFEIFCYSTDDSEDEFTQRVSRNVDVWRPVVAATDAELAAMIESDGIDILIDLAGHSGIPKLGVVVQQPAPVQATWLGYLNTTGLTRMQYRICDRHTDPPGVAERYHTERLVRLPHSQWCYRPFIPVEHDPVPPSARGEPTTFGSFNQPAKLSRAVLRLWARVLAESPGSRLLVVGLPEGVAQEAFRRFFSDAGIDPSRITLRPYLALQAYFQAFDQVDVALDTTPYSGGTTTCDTLWMGVPVVTLAGDRPVSRSAASILATVGLTECVATTPDHYVRGALRLAGDQALLAELRRTLRGRMQRSPLMDEPQFVHDLEDVYSNMWRAWCESRPRNS